MRTTPLLKLAWLDAAKGLGGFVRFHHEMDNDSRYLSPTNAHHSGNVDLQTTPGSATGWGGEGEGPRMISAGWDAPTFDTSEQARSEAGSPDELWIRSVPPRDAAASISDCRRVSWMGNGKMPHSGNQR